MKNKESDVSTDIVEELVTDLQERLSKIHSKQEQIKWLMNANALDLVEASYIHVLNGIQRDASMVEILAMVGHRIRYKLGEDKNSILAAHGGAFIVDSFINVGIFKKGEKRPIKNGKRSKWPHSWLHVSNWTHVDELWSLVDPDTKDDPILPMIEKPTEWINGYHDTGIPLVKHGSKFLLDSINPTDHSMIMDVLNKLQGKAWMINQDVYNVFNESLEKGSRAFKYSRETDKDKRKSMIFEATSIQKLADKFIDKSFYHTYNCDFRGRVYCNTAFLHEQASKISRGILKYAEGKPLGPHGLGWLLLYAANSWGYNKAPIMDRVQWGIRKMPLMNRMSKDPLGTWGNKWTSAEEPFIFLACCMEIKKIFEWIDQGNDIETYVCSLPVFIDGSNNGVQHLCALSLDEEIAPLVNLVNTDVPGDIYAYVAEEVWKEMDKREANLPSIDGDQFDRIRDEGIRLHTEYDKETDKVLRTKKYEILAKWRHDNYEIRTRLTSVYWNRIKEKSTRRKTVKRPVMTLGYGATKSGMGQQVIDDTRSLDISKEDLPDDYLMNQDYAWGRELGSMIHRLCYKSLPGPAGMLKLFVKVAERANQKGIFLSWKSPITNFPVRHIYKQPTVHRCKVTIGGEKIVLSVQVFENQRLDKGAQKSGISPNIVHSLDATHLMMTVNATPFDVSVIHDSFGCLPSDMDDLSTIVREQFVELYKGDPLRSLLRQFRATDLLPQRGSLDIYQIMNSDYAFC